MKKKKPKYFPNNWKAYKDSEDSFFIPLSYDTFYNWKVMGWAIPSSVACIIREEKDGKISEKIYSQSAAARRYLETQMSNKDASTIFTIVDENSVQILTPNKNGRKHLPRDEDIWPGLEDLTDEEIDELFG